MDIYKYYQSLDLNDVHINISYTLMETFMVKADKNLLDISFMIEGKIITIQIVLLTGATLSISTLNKLFTSLHDYEVVIKYIHLSKEQFNESKGQWSPKSYDWIGNLLFSKSEII